MFDPLFPEEGQVRVGDLGELDSYTDNGRRLGENDVPVFVR
ncbi:MAG: hypothetical protein ACE5IJ_04885 [Thermoplasmata archaeon]